MNFNSSLYENLLNELLTKAKKSGADTADAILLNNTNLSASCRLGKLEDIQRAESQDLGLRLFIGKKQAYISTSNVSNSSLDELVERGINMANAVPEDPYCGLAESDLLATDTPQLDITDKTEPTAETLLQEAQEAEASALAVKGITNSEGGESSYNFTTSMLATSNGFFGSYDKTIHSISVSVLAGSGTEMERDYEYSIACHKNDLISPQSIGKLAGEKTTRRIGARKAKSGKMPVVFDPRISNSLLQHLSNSISGSSIARSTSFMSDQLGLTVFNSGINIIDNPHKYRGLRSRPFDGEGVEGSLIKVIDNGQLSTWFLDSRSGRQLGLSSTGHASRSTSGAPSPSPTNLYIEEGQVDPSELIKNIKEGVYITELIGMGVNSVTGDYSRGASGFMIQNGHRTFPVSEITIAGNLKSMFKEITPANDLEFKFGLNAPTLRIDGMTVAGA
ncbi:MAG: modulator protein [Rhodospirillaceae bacterium]|nr:modulator protein [Alphaproteobacteria bacterium]MBR72996.1 modulator protein [Rhodospirillaceae bacterium]|tara:strand:- start:2181 stop:3527 length:1347 start_codon:yes stop_codon:yes gene_type:complete